MQTFLDHALCIAEDTPNGRHLVFPSQFRRERNIPHEPNIFISFTFTGEWQTVWTRLVVRLWYSQQFAGRALWRNAAEFASPRKDILGMRIDKAGEGAATISLYFDANVEDVLKVMFTEYAHRHLQKHASCVIRDRRYVCRQCATPVKDVDAVRQRKQAGKDFIVCQICDAKVLFGGHLIMERQERESVANRVHAMDEVATRELDAQASGADPHRPPDGHRG